MDFHYKTKGVCSRSIDFQMDGEGRIVQVEFQGGCHGNLQGIAALVEGQKAEDVISRLQGIGCNGKPTSCPDQLASALRDALEQAQDQAAGGTSAMDKLLLAASAGFTLLGAIAVKRGPALLLAVTGDEDMKIAEPGSFPSAKPVEDAASVEAKRFMRLKEDGSIERARKLGSMYATVLLEAKDELGCRDVDDPLCQHQRLVLYSYVVNRAISDLAPNSMLAQTSLNVFYDELEEASPELYRHVSDMAAFSLYILCERSNNRSVEEIGKVYARLCGSEGDPALTQEGNTLYHRFYQHCTDEYKRVLRES